MLECHLEEELQSGDRGVESDRGDATIHTMQLVAAQIFVLAVSGGRPRYPANYLPWTTGRFAEVRLLSDLGSAFRTPATKSSARARNRLSNADVFDFSADDRSWPAAADRSRSANWRCRPTVDVRSCRL
jgi:hypothetical protein